MHRFYFSPSPLGGVPLCPARRRSDGQQNVGGDAHITPPCCYRTGCPKGRDIENGREAEDAVPYNSFRQMLSDRPGGRGRPPLQVVFGNVIQKAGRIISAPTFTHTLSQRPGRRGRPPLQFVPADHAKKPPPKGGGFALLEIEMIFDDIHDEQVHHCCAGCEKSAEYQDCCCGVVREIL